MNDATIVESEVFVYNLGTMFYIDKVLFTSVNTLPSAVTTEMEEDDDLVTSTTIETLEETSTGREIESVPDELMEETGSEPDVLFADATITTPINHTVEQNE